MQYLHVWNKITFKHRISYVIQELIDNIRKPEKNVLLYQEKGTILQGSWNVRFKRTEFPPKFNSSTI